MNQPKTSQSLLIRIRNSDDRDAWIQFSDIYRPAIVRFAKQKGLQNADAEDLAQQVLIAVSKSIQSWQPDPSRASFRTWLNRVAHNAIINIITRKKPDRAAGDSQVMAMLEESPADSEIGELTIEIRREVFRYAANEIKSDFEPETWMAFWMTAVENLSVGVVSQQLGKSVGSIYAARSRVMKRLRQKVQELELTELES